MAINGLNEFEIIEKIKRWLGSQDMTIPIGDDAAAFELEPNLLSLFTSDSLIENVHFKLDSIKPFDLGYKSLVINISDIAAMGGVPKFATVTLGLPKKTNLLFLKSFYKGLKKAADQYLVSIAGGDLASAKEMAINISLIGQVEKDKMLNRSKAKIGEKILVTSTLGASALGLKIALEPKLKTKHDAYLQKKHFSPVAKVREARLAAKLGAKVAIDVSDGLISDCLRIAEESKVGFKIYAEKVPVDDIVLKESKKLNLDALDMALSGGEDYELVFTSPETIAEKITKNFDQKGWQISVIGEIIPKGIEILDKDGKQISWRKGYEHKFN
ncbi:MAG: thiamine-phosphate kinase [Actinobacteria bacterium]|nr:MAG: thiamine-phosphate kinase [Actinomycetota bacterium]